MSPLSILHAVHWYREGDTTRFSSALPYAHGFTGKGQTTLDCQFPHQVHGLDIVTVSAQTAPTATTRIAADGIFLHQTPGRIGIQTADCLPVLIASAAEPLVMALHAGWRGLSKGILQQAVQLAAQFVPQQSLYASIGPAISSSRFEVGPEVVQAFTLDTSQLATCLTKGVHDRWHVDLQQAAVFSLVQAGMLPEQIDVLRSCTYLDATRWYSYRREGYVGRNWGWIEIG